METIRMRGGPAGGSLIVLRTNVRSLERRFLSVGIQRKAARRAIARALNKTLAKTNTQAKRKIAEVRNLPVGVVGKRLHLDRASAQKLTAAIRARGPMIPLYALKGAKRQTGAGVRVRTGKGKSTLIRHAFIATMPSGHTGIFVRTGPPNVRRVRRVGPDSIPHLSQLAIRELTVPSIPHTLVQKSVTPTLTATASDEFDRQVESQLRLELSKIKR